MYQYFILTYSHHPLQLCVQKWSMCWKFELCLPLRTLFHDAMWTKMIKGKKNVYLNMIVCLDKCSLIQYLLLLQTQTLYDLFRLSWLSSYRRGPAKRNDSRSGTIEKTIHKQWRDKMFFVSYKPQTAHFDRYCNNAPRNAQYLKEW